MDFMIEGNIATIQPLLEEFISKTKNEYETEASKINGALKYRILGLKIPSELKLYYKVERKAIILTYDMVVPFGQEGVKRKFMTTLKQYFDFKGVETRIKAIR